MAPLTLFLAARLLTGGEGVPVPVQDETDETIVTARKQSEALADVPLSATVLPGRELELERLLTVHDAAARVPNVYVSEFSSRRLSFPFVRGVGSGLGDPSVITYVDDVPQFGFGGTNLPLVAVERLEVLRGPQGTLYGKNAMGGLIHVRGRRPASEGFVEVGGTFGSYDLFELSASYSGPLGAGVGGDFAVLDSQRDGFTKNEFTGNDVDDRDGSFGRGRVLWNPTPDSELDFSIFGERSRDGGFGLSFLEDFTVPGLFTVTGLRNRSHRVNHDFEGEVERDVVNPALVWRVFGDDLEFTSVSSWEAWDARETADFDFTPEDVVRRRTDEEQQYFYQELRLGSGEAHGRVRWVAGATGVWSDAERSAQNEYGASVLSPFPDGTLEVSDGDFDDFGVGVFGHVAVPLGEVFELAGGLRYDREEREADTMRTSPLGTATVDDDETFDELLPVVSASARVAETTLLYVSAARGFKAGGFNLASPAGFETFDAETSWTYELGCRQSFDAERTLVSGALFHVDWEDRQVSQFDPFAGGFVANAGDAESQGVELEGETELVRGLDARASFGWLDTEIDDTGEELPQAPETSWSLGLRYEDELSERGTWFVRADYQNVGDFFYDDSNGAGESYDVVNAGVGVHVGRAVLTVWCQNLFDEEYFPIAFQANPADPTSFVGESGAPRVVGCTLSLQL